MFLSRQTPPVAQGIEIELMMTRVRQWTLPICSLGLAVSKPGNHILRILVRREDGIEVFDDFSVASDQCDALDEGHAFNFKSREAQSVSELQRGVT